VGCEAPPLTALFVFIAQPVVLIVGIMYLGRVIQELRKKDVQGAPVPRSAPGAGNHGPAFMVSLLQILHGRFVQHTNLSVSDLPPLGVSATTPSAAAGG